MPTRRISGTATAASDPDNGGDHSGGGGDGGTFIDDVFSTYLYEGTGADQTIRNGIELGGGTLLAGSWCFQDTWEADKVIGSFSGAKTGDYIVGISVGVETAGPAEIKANGVVVPITSTGKDPQGYHDSVHLMQVDADGDIDITSSVNMWAANFVLIRGASEIVPKTALTVGTFTSIQDPSYSSDGSGLFLLSDRSPYSANFGDLNKYSSEVKTFSTYIGGISGDGSSVAEVNVTGLAPSYANCYATFEMKGMPDATPTQLQGGEGGMVWIKNRDAGRNHFINDTERGPERRLQSNSTGKEYDTTNGGYSGLSSFNSNGFTLGNDTDANADDGTNDYVSWTFRKQPKFFDVVTYTGDGVVGLTVPHNLGITPGMLVIKRTDSSADWQVFFPQVLGTKRMKLNEASPAVGTGWSDPMADASSFTLETNLAELNALNGEYVAYLFAHDDSDEGMIQCGSYTGTGAPGHKIDLGWEPQWIMVKSSTSNKGWFIQDSTRGITCGGVDSQLMADTNAAEISREIQFDLNPDGFTLTSADLDVNGISNEYIYMAIRRPNKPAEEFEPEELFAVDTMGSAGDGKPPAFRSPLPIDMAIRSDTGGASHEIASRLNAGKWLYTDQTAAESSTTNYADFDFQNGWSNSGTTASNYVSHMWRRAPGFFDTVCYEGNGSSNVLPHNLQSQPEMVWLKVRESTYNNTSANRDWGVMHKDGGDPRPTHQLGYWDSPLNKNEPFKRLTLMTDATPEQITIHSTTKVNTAGNKYIAYLFASVPGICDIGSYTGNGTTLDIDCGFTNGVRFILIKRTDVSGNWTFWDTERGISSGDDPFLELNNTGAQTKNLNCLSPLSSGVTVKHPSVNTDGGTYIYMAIA